MVKERRTWEGGEGKGGEREERKVTYHDLLSSRELEGCTTCGFNNVLGHVVLAADGEDDLSNLDTGHDTIRLSEGTTHSSLESVYGN